MQEKKNLTLIDQYISDCDELLLKYDNNIRDKQYLFKLYWKKWVDLHSKTLVRLANHLTIEEDTPDWEKNFLKARERILSVFIQQLKSNRVFDIARQNFSEILRQHDLCFGYILQSIQNELRRELTKAFAVRTAVRGYAKTSMFGG